LLTSWVTGPERCLDFVEAGLDRFGIANVEHDAQRPAASFLNRSNAARPLVGIAAGNRDGAAEPPNSVAIALPRPEPPPVIMATSPAKLPSGSMRVPRGGAARRPLKEFGGMIGHLTSLVGGRALLAERGAGFLIVFRLEQRGLRQQFLRDAATHCAGVDLVDHGLGHGERDGRLGRDLAGEIKRAGIKLVGATTKSTAPHASAVSASILSPVITMYFVRLGPISVVINWCCRYRAGCRNGFQAAPS
jgi:hypothetical protein